MSSYSLTSDSRRWWWLPATAGALGTAAVTAILIVPITGSATPVDSPPPTIGGAGLTGSVTVVERPCYLARHDWNTIRGWEQPVCRTQIGGRADDAAPPARRRAPDYLP